MPRVNQGESREQEGAARTWLAGALCVVGDPKEAQSGRGPVSKVTSGVGRSQRGRLGGL